MKKYDELKTRRINVNKTQSDIANEMGISLQHFQRYESGEVDPPFAKALKWAKALDLSIEQFKEYYIKDKEA